MTDMKKKGNCEEVMETLPAHIFFIYTYGL